MYLKYPIQTVKCKIGTIITSQTVGNLHISVISV